MPYAETVIGVCGHVCPTGPQTPPGFVYCPRCKRVTVVKPGECVVLRKVRAVKPKRPPASKGQGTLF